MAKLNQKIAWDEVADADTYTAKLLTSGGTLLSEVPGLVTPEVELSVLAAGQVAGSYQVRAVAVNGAGASPESAPLGITIDAPEAPINLRVV